MDTASRMHTAIEEFAGVVAKTASGIGTGQLGDRTPCETYTVAELLAHLGHVVSSSERAARKEPQPGPDTPSDAPTSPAAVAEHAVRAAAAWRDPEAYEGTVEFGPGEMPAAFAAAITVQELALHGWDLARAAGLPYAVSDDAAGIALEAVEQIADTARANGAYGPPVAVDPGAPALHRALATSGRNPEWSA